MTPGAAALLAAAGLAAGAVNSVAGGGSLLSFPALLAVGYPSVQANVTNTIALFPGYAGSVAGGRKELRGKAPVLRSSILSALVGAVIGAVLLLNASSDLFDQVVPFLILVACVLLALQPRLSRVAARMPGFDRQHRSPPLQLGILISGIYGAYFGAGLGVLFIGVLGIFLTQRLQVVNAVKNVLSLAVNAVALVAYAIFAPVAWSAVAVIAVASLAGGYGGARLVGRIPAGGLRLAIIVYGVAVALVLIARNL